MYKSSIFVSGLVNIESSVPIGSFPIYDNSDTEYLFNGISNTVSGVGYNVSKALQTLGDDVHLHTLIGQDPFGKVVVEELQKNGIGIEGVYHFLDATPHSVILYDREKKQKILCDLKNIQTTSYPDAFMYDISYDVAILTNVNFSREFFKRFSHSKTLVATDCHVLKDINSKYDKEFLENADIVFMSNEAIKGREYDFIKELIRAYNHIIIVISMGDQGSIIFDREADSIKKVDARVVRPIVNTIGAGDALFSSFLHFYIAGLDSLDAINLATYFASYKIGANGGAEGFLTEDQLLDLANY